MTVNHDVVGSSPTGGVRKKNTIGVFFCFSYVIISPSRSVRCASKIIPKNSKRDTIKVFKPIVKRKEKNMAQKAHSLSHTKWMCKYHIVFTPKYR